MLGFVVSSHQSAGGAISIADTAVVLLYCAPQLMIATYNLYCREKGKQQKHYPKTSALNEIVFCKKKKTQKKETAPVKVHLLVTSDR